jgi:hypothetical protein
MAKSSGTFMKFIGFLLILSCTSTKAQILQDTTTLSLVKKNIDYIYNLQFDYAREIHSKISRSYPGHPVVFLLSGMLTYWENYPMLSTSSSRYSFEEDMNRCVRISENNKNPDHEAEYLLADLCARGMLLLYYADNDLTMKVIPLTISTYKYLRRSFDFASVSSDLNYFTGVYNYYREAYPNAYPVYKSLVLLFPVGDMKAGLKQLHIAAVNSIVLRAESYYLLMYIYISFENDYHEALIYSKSLHELYPNNVLYQSLYIKNLLLLKNYDEAEKLIITSPDEEGNRYFHAQLSIFKGILQEKKYLNNKLAQEYYEKGISDISNFESFGNEYSAYAYYGLSRISVANGDKHSSKIYRKEAIELADFKKINFDK